MHLLPSKLGLNFAGQKLMQVLAVLAHENTGAMIKIMDFIADLFFQLVDWS